MFRDRVLSDLIGFTYRSWAPGTRPPIWSSACARSGRARRKAKNPGWSPSPSTGRTPGSTTRTTATSSSAGCTRPWPRDPGFRCVTVGEFLAENPPQRELPWLHTGSWVFGDFSTWIGDPAHGPAWDLLHRARDRVAARRDATDGSPATLDGPWPAAMERPPSPALGPNCRRRGGGVASHPDRRRQRLVLVVQHTPGERGRLPVGSRVPRASAGSVSVPGGESRRTISSPSFCRATPLTRRRSAEGPLHARHRRSDFVTRRVGPRGLPPGAAGRHHADVRGPDPGGGPVRLRPGVLLSTADPRSGRIPRGNTR